MPERRGDRSAAAPPAGPSEAPPRWSLPAAIFGFGALGAALLLVAEFTTLFTLRLLNGRAAVQTEMTGSHHAFALLPLGILAALLAFGVWRAQSRPALLALGALAVVALLIALIGDLPDTHASGLRGSPAAGYHSVEATPGPGIYLETAGAVILLITCVSGFILAGPPEPRERPAGRSSRTRRPDVSAP